MLSGSVAYALLNLVATTDIVQITDKPSKAQAPKDSLPLSSTAAPDGKSIKDTVPLSDSASRNDRWNKDTEAIRDFAKTDAAKKDNISIQDKVFSDRTARDTMILSDSPAVQSNFFHAVYATDMVGIVDTLSPSSSAMETLGLSDSASFPIFAISDLVSISEALAPSVSIFDIVGIDDATARSFFADVTDATGMSDLVSALVKTIKEVIDVMGLTDQTDVSVQSPPPQSEDENNNNGDTEGGKGSPTASHLVYDESYFSDHPLSRLSFRSVSIVDSDGRLFSAIPAGEQLEITALVRNYQKVDQTFSFIIQIEGQNGYTIAILTYDGIIQTAETAELSRSWTPMETGHYSVKIMIWDDLDNPSQALTPSISKVIRIT